MKRSDALSFARQNWMVRRAAWEAGKYLFFPLPGVWKIRAGTSERVALSADFGREDWNADDWEVGPRFSPPVPVEIPDFVLVRYLWDSGGGNDLDTRTAIVVPAGQTFTGDDVGFSRGYNVDFAGDTVLALVTDNATSAGPESVVLYVARLFAAVPSAAELKLRCRVYWFGSVGSGEFRVQVEAWKGGSVSAVAYDWQVDGGRLLSSVETPKRSTLHATGASDGEDVCAVYVSRFGGVRIGDS